MKIFKTLVILVLATCLYVTGASADTAPPQEVFRSWYRLALELVRHTATYTPPVASRSFAYMSIAAFEAAASGSTTLQSLNGQVQSLPLAPLRENDKAYDDAIVMHATMSQIVENLFLNTGPSGQHAISAFEKKMASRLAQDISSDIALRSAAFGRQVADNILKWSMDDGGAVIQTMGFSSDYVLNAGPAHWVPTNTVNLQQKPLLPNWGKNRTFAMPTGAACKLPPPPNYSEDVNSEFYKQATEVVEVKRNLTPEQKAIAKFWSDDAMLSVTPPGHWISIALQILEKENAGLDKMVDVLARLSIAEADAFIGCWNAKYQYDLLRPITYIKRVIDPKWESLINTPPFPEYPSGHSTQSGAAAVVLTQIFGENFAFTDTTGTKDGLKPRTFTSFAAAAEEAGMSRLYGGIHFRAAVENGLAQGRCIGAFAIALKTRK
jgi:hypothetical protein